MEFSQDVLMLLLSIWFVVVGVLYVGAAYLATALVVRWVVVLPLEAVLTRLQARRQIAEQIGG